MLPAHWRWCSEAVNRQSWSVSSASLVYNICMYTDMGPTSLYYVLYTDISTVRNLELITNITDSKSPHSLFGVLNHTKTPQGGQCIHTICMHAHSDLSILKRELGKCYNILLWFLSNPGRLLRSNILQPPCSMYMYCACIHCAKILTKLLDFQWQSVYYNCIV